MPVNILSSSQEEEEKGNVEVEFVGFRYTGENSTKVDRDLCSRIGYTGSPKFQQGRVYFALLPTWADDTRIENSNIGAHALEARGDFEVIYDPERLAQALLDRNYLPTDVFYEGFDRYKRQKVLKKLNLDDVEGHRIHEKDDEEPYRDALREIANVERDDEAAISQQRAEKYVGRFSRSDAKEIVKLLRQDSGEIDLRTAGQIDLCEYLTRFEPDVVEDAADIALGDGDPDDLDIRLKDEYADTGSGEESTDEASDREADDAETDTDDGPADGDGDA